LPPVGGIWLPEKRKLFDFSMDYRPSEKWGEMAGGGSKIRGKRWISSEYPGSATSIFSLGISVDRVLEWIIMPALFSNADRNDSISEVNGLRL